MSDATERVADMLAELKGLACAPAPDARLFEDVGLTSFDLMVACVRLEELAGRTLSFTELAGARTVADLARLVDEPS